MTHETDRPTQFPAPDELAQVLSDRKRVNGGVRKIYRREADELKQENLCKDIVQKTEALIEATKRNRVNFYDLDDVKARTMTYLKACAESGTFPSVQGVASFAYGVSRRAIYAHMQQHPESEFSQYFDLVRELIADVVANAALKRDADNAMAIFILKNNHGFSDRIELEPVHQVSTESDFSSEDIAKRYNISIEEE